MNNPPLVSIIMPVYNTDKFVSEAILSVIGQSYAQWELLIINDGSTDASLDIIQAYQDSRIRVFTQKNQGVSKARNLGLEEMKGDFFCFFDSDDFLPQLSIESRIKVFERDPHIGYVDGSVDIKDADLNEIINQRTPNYVGNPQKGLCQLDGGCFFGNTWMIKRDKSITYFFDKNLSHGEALFVYLT